MKVLLVVTIIWYIFVIAKGEENENPALEWQVMPNECVHNENSRICQREKIKFNKNPEKCYEGSSVYKHQCLNGELWQSWDKNVAPGPAVCYPRCKNLTCVLAEEVSEDTTTTSTRKPRTRLTRRSNSQRRPN